MFFTSNKITRNVPPILTMQKKNLFAKLSLVEAGNASATVRQSSSTTDLDFEQNRFPPRIPLFFFPPQVPLFFISTECALRLPTTYDKHPANPIPSHSIHPHIAVKTTPRLKISSINQSNQPTNDYR